MSNWKCLRCGGGKAKTTRENEPMDEAMPGIVLLGVEVTKCLQCGNREVAIPHLDALLKLVAETIVKKPGRLTGDEVRVVRSYLELSGTELAEIMDATPATVSRWENNKTPVGRTADLLLRAIVMLHHGQQIPVSTFRSISGLLAEDREARVPAIYQFKLDGGAWKSVGINTLWDKRLDRKAAKRPRRAGRTVPARPAGDARSRARAGA
jgi:putative zinc finger/helix-turn-helix YgiT family protein